MIRGRCADIAWLAPVPFVIGALLPWPSHALDIQLQSIGVRARVGETRVLGKEQLESFHEYDLTTTVRLPWDARFRSGWGVGTRLLASAGALEGADKVALVVSAVPLLAFGTRDGRFNLDMGVGLALLSKHRYAQQDYGGPLQAALTLGFDVPLYRHAEVGYRFMHYSDAGAYGSDSIGADFHMVELLYRF
jgi:hypothetical protein